MSSITFYQNEKHRIGLIATETGAQIIFTEHESEKHFTLGLDDFYAANRLIDHAVENEQSKTHDYDGVKLLVEGYPMIISFKKDDLIVEFYYQEYQKVLDAFDFTFHNDEEK